MGNYKFRFADIMPNAWFYMLKDMSSNKRGSKNMKKNQSNSVFVQSPKQGKSSQNLASHGRKSYYFNREPIANFDTFYNSLSNPEIQSHFYHDPPKKSATVSKHAVKIKPRRSLPVSKQLISNSSVSGGLKCNRNVFSPENSFSPPKNSVSDEFESRSDETLVTKSTSCVCKSNSDEKDIIIDFEKKIDLAAIITTKLAAKPKKQQILTITEKNRGSTKSAQKNPGQKSYSPSGGRMKLRTKSPRIANLNVNGVRKSVSSSTTTTTTTTSSGSRRSNISDSVAVVKSSYNPQKDFKESMMEMIVENNIRASKDLEELLACYLSLNSDEYHDLIIKVFKQIWFDLLDMQIKKK